MSKAYDPRLSVDNRERNWAETWHRHKRMEVRLKQQGCVFRKGENINNHELDIRKECRCGRPNKVNGV